MNGIFCQLLRWPHKKSLKLSEASSRLPVCVHHKGFGQLASQHSSASHPPKAGLEMYPSPDGLETLLAPLFAAFSQLVSGGMRNAKVFFSSTWLTKKYSN